MAIRECAKLDDYLDGDLGPAAAAQFESHADQCPDCCEAIDQQRWIDGLLRSATVRLGEVPPGWEQAIRATTAARRRRAQLAACGLAAAVIVAAAFGWTALRTRVGGAPALSSAFEEPLPPAEIPAPPAELPIPPPTTVEENKLAATQPQATFSGGPEVIAVPVESRHANVTILRVYPTLGGDRWVQVQAHEQPPAEDEFDRLQPFPGG